MSGKKNKAGNERRKNAFFRYFELLISKIDKLFYLNIVYLIFILPLLCGLVALALNMFGVPPEFAGKVSIFTYAVRLSYVFPQPVSMILFVASAVLYGPITAGFTYMVRNYVSGRHVWFSELFKRAKENFKQGFLLGIIDIIVVISLLMYAALDISKLDNTQKLYYGFMRTAFFIVFIFYVYMRHYLYLLAVTFDLSLKAVFKNSAIFAVLGVINNTVATLIILVITWTFNSTPAVDAVLIVSIYFSLCAFTSMFAAYPIVKKYMLEEKSGKSDGIE
ncbi:MAG: hypothetical protein GX541_04500 [Clostridiales bacterium]|jgi:uncharacterized membrane protein YesL|nr:hypothetical protein [Clostridiales bacterium]